jgi:hypothetical protein
MTELMRGWMKRLAPFLLAIGLTVGGPPLAQTARAQPPQPAEAEEGGSDKGRPLDGYLATACLVFLVLFIVGKSARR